MIKGIYLLNIAIFFFNIMFSARYFLQKQKILFLIFVNDYRFRYTKQIRVTSQNYKYIIFTVLLKIYVCNSSNNNGRFKISFSIDNI